MSSQSLSQRQVQTLRLSPQQILYTKLLQLPALQLEQRIKQELEENPVLEEVSDQDKADELEAIVDDAPAPEPPAELTPVELISENSSEGEGSEMQLSELNTKDETAFESEIEEYLR
ncbi:MAG: RNA polymerase sigma-54 factor, partial [Candidatus Thermochlorobacter sp.]